MKLIDYDKYTKKWSPRSTIVLAVVEAVVAGFFLGAALIEAVRGHDVWVWIWPLVMGFASGVGALQATLVALHTCPPSAKTRQSETVPNSARV
ncbi:MAG: hypothetical protein HY233_00510 [Acidobacteriales bacterium]|nr:hypothetical protein [Terriglobales bacterium]